MEVDSPCAVTVNAVNGSELFEYSHIMVPPSMRSRYWQYFGFPCDNYNNIVTKKKIICTLCSTVIAYNRNTTNLRTHLAAKHHDILHELDDRKRLKTDDHKLPDNSVEVKLNIQNIRTITEKDLEALHAEDDQTKINEQTAIIEALVENDIIENETDKMNESSYSSSLEPQTYQVDVEDVTPSLSQKVVSDALTNMLINDLLPPSVINGAGFTNFVFTIAPTIGLPNRKRIEGNINTAHTTFFNSRLATITAHASKRPFSVGVDVWYNAEQNQFANVYINYISHGSDQQLQQFLFKTVCLTESKSLDIFEDINLANCSGAVVNCCVETISGFFNARGIPVVPCFAAIIQKCMHQAFNNTQVKKVCRQIEGYLKNYEAGICQSDSSPPPSIDDNFPLTKLQLLSYFYDKYSTTYSSWTDETSEFLEQTKEIIDCLTPLKLTLETLSDETVALCSLLKPLATKLLNEYFCIYDEESQTVASLKEIVNQVLTESIMNDTFLTLATFFDPRFLNFIDVNNFDRIKDEIKLKLEKDKDDSCSIKEENDKQIARKSSLKMFFQNDDLKRTPKVSKSTFELEIQKYMSELCDMEQCPLTWWNAYGCIYRNLKNLAHKYICVPATVNDSFKKSISEQMDFYNKRLMIRKDCEKSLLFLHLNKIRET